MADPGVGFFFFLFFFFPAFPFYLFLSFLLPLRFFLYSSARVLSCSASDPSITKRRGENRISIARHWMKYRQIRQMSEQLKREARG